MTILDTRAQLAADDTLVGRDLCEVWTGEVDRWLDELFTVAVEGGEPGGVALVAVGGYGRGELSLQSDIDVLLLHGGRSDIGELADRLWYPIWDVRLKLGHAVRTPKEALALAADDLDTATGLLQARHLAGDRALTDELARRAELQWHKRAKRWLAALASRVRERHLRAGEVAFLLEPDLKEGRGGMRDVHALAWAQAARTILWDEDHGPLDDAYATLLGARVELHRRTGRPGDRLALQEQDAVAAALGYADADLLMRAIAHAARTIAWTSDDAWARIESSLTGPLGRARRERALGGGLTLRDGEVHVRDDVDVARDPAVALQAAAVAAHNATQLDRRTLARLAAESPAPAAPWTPATRAALVDLLLAGPPALLLLEALDQQGIWERYFPEWPLVRSKPQRNAYHRFTVDRHLWEAAVQAGALAGRVRRPDLLVLAGLLHDIGKGRGGDHTDNGVEMLAEISPRMGLDPHDAAVLRALCRHHLLLADVATRRDIDDPATIDAVVAAVGDRDVLELLAALTEADSLATGPAAWSDWKAGLVRALVARVDHVIGGGAAVEVADEFPTAEQRARLREGVQADRDRRRAPDRGHPRPTGAVRPGRRGAVAARARRRGRRGRHRRRVGHRGVPGGVELRAHVLVGQGGRRPGPGPGGAPRHPGPPGRPGPDLRVPAARPRLRRRRRAGDPLRPGRDGRRHRRRGPRARRPGRALPHHRARSPTSTSTSWGPRSRPSAPRSSTRSSCAPPTAPRSPTRRCWPRPSAPCCTPWRSRRRSVLVVALLFDPSVTSRTGGCPAGPGR